MGVRYKRVELKFKVKMNEPLPGRWHRRAGDDEAGYRRRIPPSVPRTMARAMVLPMEPPTDLPMLPATPPITRLVTERVTSRATRWVGDST